MTSRRGRTRRRRYLTFRDEPDAAPYLTSNRGWIRRFSRLSSYGPNPYEPTGYKADY